jgi:6-phosphogluconolactonase
MEIKVPGDAEAASREAARFIAAEARAAVTARGRFILAFSGGHSPKQMLQALAGEQVPWDKVHVVQVDERVAPAGHPDRNLTLLSQSLLKQVPVPQEQVHPMPVEESDLEAAAATYARALQQIAGSLPVIDLVHLGIGPDGHTASLVPGDPVLAVRDRDIAITGPYQQRRRMTMTFPLLNRSRRILWLVIEPTKAPVLARLSAADTSIPAGRIRQDRAVLFADQATAGVSDVVSP